MSQSYEQEEEDHYGPGYEVGSYTKDYNDGPYDGDNDLNTNSNPEGKPRILLMGLRRSGKSSIQKVVFHKMSPNETLFLESTNKIVKDEISNSSFVQFQIWDFPGQVDFFDPNFDCEMIFGGCGKNNITFALNGIQIVVTSFFLKFRGSSLCNRCTGIDYNFVHSFLKIQKNRLMVFFTFRMITLMH